MELLGLAALARLENVVVREIIAEDVAQADAVLSVLHRVARFGNISMRAYEDLEAKKFLISLAAFKANKKFTDKPANIDFNRTDKGSSN